MFEVGGEAGYELGWSSVEAMHVGMGLMTRDQTTCLLFHLQASQMCLQVAGPTTQVAADVSALVSALLSHAEANSDVAEVGESSLLVKEEVEEGWG